MSTRYAFELDHTSTYLRNRDMHNYYRKLNKIMGRKNTFLPKITPRILSVTKKKGSQPLKFATHSIYEKYVIKRDNEIIYNKLNRIHNRSCQAIDDEATIQKYLNIKKNTREGLRKIKENLLKESNIKIKDQIYKTKPVLNSLKLKNDFLVTRNYYNNLRKIRPNQSMGDIFLTKNESEKIDKYFDIHNLKCINKKAVDNNYRYNVNSNKNKYLLKKLGYDINIKNILSNSQELI